MMWGIRQKKRASIKQKVDFFKIGKNYARLLIKKWKLKESQKDRDAAEIKHIRYCEYIYASQIQNSQETNPLLEKWNVPEWLCRNNNLYRVT